MAALGVCLKSKFRRVKLLLCVCVGSTEPIPSALPAPPLMRHTVFWGEVQRDDIKCASCLLLSFLFFLFFFLLALSCVWRLLRFSSQRRQKRRRGNHLKCDKLKGKPPGMNERQRGSIRSSVQSTPVADQRSALNKSPRCRLQRAASSFFFFPPMDDLNRSV